MLSLNLAFPLLYLESSPLILAACASKTALEFYALCRNKTPKTALLQLLALGAITNYLGLLLIVGPPFLQLPNPGLLYHCPPPQALPISALLISILLPGLLCAFIAKKVLGRCLEHALAVGAASSAGAILMGIACALK
jgi:hypothetical protein